MVFTYTTYIVHTHNREERSRTYTGLWDYRQRDIIDADKYALRRENGEGREQSHYMCYNY